MDAEDESPGYLKFLNDGHSYLLHSSEDGLTDTFTNESIFTEIPSEWPSDGFSILLSGALITEDNNEDTASNSVQLLSENDTALLTEDSNSNTLTFYSNVELPSKNGVQSSSLILSNDLLLKLKANAENIDNDSQNEKHNTVPDTVITQVINGSTYSFTYAAGTKTGANKTVADENKTKKSPEETVIQLLNLDGSVTTIDKNALNIVDNQESSSSEQPNDEFKDYYTEVKVYRCKVCSHMCESVDDIGLHIVHQHAREIEEKTIQGSRIIKDSDLVGTNMRSILNTNKDKKYTMFLCSECGNAYSSKEDLKHHMISQHNLVFVGPKPPQKTVQPQGENAAKSNPADNDKSKLSSRAHAASFLKKQQKAMKKVKCSIKGCPLRFAKDELRKRHEVCHVNREKKQFMCPECKEKFSIWRICSMHMWKCHSIDVGLLTCPMCNKFKSNSAVRVINHMGIHNETKPFICASCGKGFKQLNQLRNHEILHRSPENLPDWYTVKKCEFCDRQFANSKCLKKHIKFVHDKFKPFICNICGHQTARKAMLQLHYRQHTGDKPHQCSYCEYKTGDHNCLRKHMMRHFGVMKYSCPYCTYQSIQSSSYKTHLANKHPGKEGTYSCTVCTYTTINVASYLSHVKCHELELKRQKGIVETSDGKGVKIQENKTDLGKLASRSIVEKESATLPEDDETQNCFLSTEHAEETVDTGGITIPAGFDMQLVTQN